MHGSNTQYRLHSARHAHQNQSTRSPAILHGIHRRREGRSDAHRSWLFHKHHSEGSATSSPYPDASPNAYKHRH
ncbi:uncharacterized protein M6B38_263995 [Iris pallida]|uniref:Uncharacterized protein n=1 Tax=Iris pallida TaxID=29817 RepID=A0AAX6ICR5_IRIPA|nr:uncharacterized protein M6B38_263995 [Iris pallida]